MFVFFFVCYSCVFSLFFFVCFPLTLYISCVFLLFMVKVFVYGILVGRYGGRPASLWGAEKFFRGHATFRWSDDHCVCGELINVSKETLEEFDRIEGVASGYYHRFLVSVEDDLGVVHDGVWVYQQVEDMVK